MNALVSTINYVDRHGGRMLYRANDSSRDTIRLAPEPMEIVDARAAPSSVNCEGYQIVSAVMTRDKTGRPAPDIDSARELIARITGADLVVATAPAVHRFAENDALSGQLDNSRPARFAHVDVSDTTAQAFSQRSCPPGLQTPSRSAHFNLWCVTSPAPQNVPLALCDARSFDSADLLVADAVFDRNGEDIWAMEGLVLAHSPRHRWVWFRDMEPGEALLFKTWDSAPDVAHCVPHVAFDNPEAPPGTPPRASAEARFIAYWT